MIRLLLLPAALLFLGAPVSQDLKAARDHKVWICHIPPGNPANMHDIFVDFHAVPAHLHRHGDFIGSCADDQPL